MKKNTTDTARKWEWDFKMRVGLTAPPQATKGTPWRRLAWIGLVATLVSLALTIYAAV